MATAEDLLRMLTAMEDNTKKLSEAILQVARDNQTRPERRWYEVDRFKNVKEFSGKIDQLEEWYGKMKSQIKSGSSEAMDVIGLVENNFTEKQLQNLEYGREVAKECISGAEDVLAISYRLYNILINITTGDAHAVVRRCPEENGLLAWKRLCTTLNPRTLASGVKAINQVLNPSKVTDPKENGHHD